MFGSLFKKKPKEPNPDYVNYLSKLVKYKQVTLQLKELPEDQITLLTFFFEQTGTEIRQLCSAAGVLYVEPSRGEQLAMGLNVVNVFDLSEKHLNAERVISMEVYPIYSVNRQLVDFFKDADVKTITYYLGMDEPLMQLFGSERIIQLLRKMGTKDEESIQHPMVDKSIERAQLKLENNRNPHNPVRTSQEDWMDANKHLF